MTWVWPFRRGPSPDRDVPWIAPELGEPEGLVGVGGALTPDLLLKAYCEGVFPWFSEGDPILFEHPNSVHRSRLRAVDVRPMHAWEFYDAADAQARVFAGEAVAALRELGVTADRVGVDRIGAPGFLALQRAGLTLVDSSPATQEAREIKTSQEIVAQSGRSTL